MIKSRILKWAGHGMEDRGAFKIIIRKPTGKRSLRRPRRRW